MTATPILLSIAVGILWFTFWECASISVHLRQISEELSHLRNADDKADVEEAVYLLESRERSAKRIREVFQ